MYVKITWWSFPLVFAPLLGLGKSWLVSCWPSKMQMSIRSLCIRFYLFLSEPLSWYYLQICLLWGHQGQHKPRLCYSLYLFVGVPIFEREKLKVFHTKVGMTISSYRELSSIFIPYSDYISTLCLLVSPCTLAGEWSRIGRRFCGLSDRCEC